LFYLLSSSETIDSLGKGVLNDETNGVKSI